MIVTREAFTCEIRYVRIIRNQLYRFVDLIKLKRPISSSFILLFVVDFVDSNLYIFPCTSIYMRNENQSDAFLTPKNYVNKYIYIFMMKNKLKLFEYSRLYINCLNINNI